MLPKKPESQRLKDDLALYKKRAHDYWAEIKILTAENKSLAEGLRKALIGQGCKPYEADEFVAMHRNSDSTPQSKP